MNKSKTTFEAIIKKLRAARKKRDEIKELISAQTPVSVTIAGETFLFTESDDDDACGCSQPVLDRILDAALSRMCKRVQALETELIEATYE